MIKSPGTYYDELRLATRQALVLTLVSLGLTVSLALAGFTRGVITMRGATLSLAYALAVFLGLYLIASGVRWMNSRRLRTRRE